MALFNKFSPFFPARLNRNVIMRVIALTGIILIFTFSRGASSPDELRQLKEKMAALQSQIVQEELRRKKLSIKESQLAKKINLLKKEAESSPNLLLNLRIESSLKELRENLIIQQKSESRRTILQEQILQTREELDAQMEKEINRLIQSASMIFREGDEKEADRIYQEALQLMEEHKKDQALPVISPPILPPVVALELNGKESPEKLRELADFAIHDLENLKKEIKLLEDNKKQIEEEIMLRKNLIKYAGLLERGDNASAPQIELIQKEVNQFENNSKIMENSLIKAKQTHKLLTRKIGEIERLIEQQGP